MCSSIDQTLRAGVLPPSQMQNNVQQLDPSQPMTTQPGVTLPPVPMDQMISARTSSIQLSSTPSLDNPSTGEESAALSQDDEKKNIYLNFENTDLANFIDYIAELKKLNILLDKSIEGSKISLTIRDPLSVTGAWNVFITVLEMSGFSIVKTGLVHKVVPKDKKIQQPLPAFINTPYEKLPDNDLTIRYVFFLSNIPTTDVQPLLESMLSQPNAIYENKEMNAFVITDKALNIRSAVKLLHELDSMGTPENVTVMRLKRINAADAKTLLDALIQKPDTNPLARLLGKTTEGSTEYFSATTRVIAEERSNSLILLGTKKSVDKVIDFISNHIDTDLKAAKSPLHIYELQHIDAAQVMEILKLVTAQPDSATGQVAGKYGAIRGGVKYFKSMTFNIDKDGNRLIANCPDPQDWELVKKTIIDLDKPQPQVAIESMIVSINASEINQLGGAVRNKKHGQLGKNIDFQSASISGKLSLEGDENSPVSLLGNMLGQLTSATGATVLSFGKNTIWGALRALKTQDNSSVLSQPFITVANKTKGTITVGESKRVSYENTGSGDPSAPQSFKDVKATTSVEITPQINLDGIIRMKINIVIEDFLDLSGDNISNQTLASKVTVADGQVLALGGFIKTSVAESKDETPLLGKIPLIGWFFKNQNRTILKQYIFVFLAPTIVKPRETPGMNLYTKMKLHEATASVEDAVETKRTIDPVHNWYFNAEKENYSHKVIDFANARYQPTTVDIKNDSFYRSAVDDDQTTERHDQTKKQSVLEAVLPPHITAAPEASQIEYAYGQQAPLIPVAPTPTPLDPTTDAIIIPPLHAPIVTNNNDPSLDAQRLELRRILATPAQEAPPSSVPGDPAKIIPAQETSFDLIVDPNKRNSLKEFLAASPATVQNNTSTSAMLGGS